MREEGRSLQTAALFAWCTVLSVRCRLKPPTDAAPAASAPRLITANRLVTV
jgi:hypothetical protein